MEAFTQDSLDEMVNYPERRWGPLHSVAKALHQLEVRGRGGALVVVGGGGWGEGSWVCQGSLPRRGHAAKQCGSMPHTHATRAHARARTHKRPTPVNLPHTQPTHVQTHRCTRAPPTHGLQESISGKKPRASLVQLTQSVSPAVLPPPPIDALIRRISAKQVQCIMADLRGEAERINRARETQQAQQEEGGEKLGGLLGYVRKLP